MKTKTLYLRLRFSALSLVISSSKLRAILKSEKYVENIWYVAIQKDKFRVGKKYWLEKIFLKTLEYYRIGRRPQSR